MTTVEFSPTGNLILSGSKDCTIRLWLPTVKGSSTKLKPHTAAVRSVSFSKDGSNIVTASDDKSVKIFGVQGFRFQSSLIGHTHWVRTAKFSPDGRLIASGSDDKTVKLWDLRRGNTIHTFYDHLDAVNSGSVGSSLLLTCL